MFLAMVEPGQEIVTSGYNAVFPEGIPIGKVKEVSQGNETNYLDITITLGADFSKLNFVYLVKNDLREEIDSLETVMVNPSQWQQLNYSSIALAFAFTF